LSIQRRLEEVFLELKGESEYILEPEVRMSLNPVNWTLHKFLHLVITLSFFRGSKYLWGRPSEGIRRPMEFLEPPRAEVRPTSV